MMEDMDRFFENFGSASSLFPTLQGARQLWSRGTWSPEVEVSERDRRLLVTADLPGIRKEDIDIELQDGALILRGQRNEEREEQRGDVSYSERSYGSFVRSIALPPEVKSDDIDATFQNGVLQVTLPLPQESRRRRIQISAGEEGEQQGRNLSAGASEGQVQERRAHN